MDGLRAAGVTHFQIVVGWRAEVVREYFGDGSPLGVSIEYATQVVQDGTGRVVELAKEFAGDDAFILSYGDILIDPANYRRLCGSGRRGGAGQRIEATIREKSRRAARYS